jgi:hypothetical protein
MARDLTVILMDRPGTLADMGEALGEAGINIEGACGFPCEGMGVAHILVEDVAGARRVLEAHGFQVGGEREVLVLEIEDQPGALGKITRRIADAGVNVDLVYLAAGGQVVIGADDLDRARAAL